MKKKLHKILAFVLGTTMFLSMAACGSGQSSQPPSPGTGAPAAPSESSAEPSGDYLSTLTPPSSKRALAMGTGASSGEVYILGGAIANSVNLHSDWFTLTSETATGGSENLRNMEDEIIDIGIMNSDTGYDYYASTNDYEGAGNDSLRSMIVFPPSPMHVVVRAGSGIKDISDLRGRNVAVSTVGTGYETFARKVVSCAEMTYDDMQTQMINVNQMADAMKNGQIDAFFFPVQAPAGTITELALSLDIEVLSLSDEFIAKFLDENPGYVTQTIPAGTYQGQDKDIVTVATARFAPVLRDAFTEDEAYVFLRNIFDNRDEWVTVYSSATFITDTNIEGLIVPLHAGAVRFYQERGVEIPDELIPPELK